MHLVHDAMTFTVCVCISINKSHPKLVLLFSLHSSYRTFFMIHRFFSVTQPIESQNLSPTIRDLMYEKKSFSYYKFASIRQQIYEYAYICESMERF